MRKHYDFSKMKSRPNPFAKKLKRQVTLRIAKDTIDYFQSMASITGIPYQNLIDSYLADCAMNKKKISWA